MHLNIDLISKMGIIMSTDCYYVCIEINKAEELAEPILATA